MCIRDSFRAGLEQIDVRDAVVFDDCGHMPQLEYPQEFAEQYQRFLFGVWATPEDAEQNDEKERVAGK